jgi:hypothetical protein
MGHKGETLLMSSAPDKIVVHTPDAQCPHCGKIHSGEPGHLIALTAYLSSRQYVPYSRLTELIKSMTNISMSEGTIFNLLNKAANLLLPIYNGIKEELSYATTVGGDETGMKVEKNKFWVWTWQTLQATYIVISKSRGFVTVENTFPEGFINATFVSDSLNAQLKTPARRHQLCLAHLLRELNFQRRLWMLPLGGKKRYHPFVISVEWVIDRIVFCVFRY